MSDTSREFEAMVEERYRSMSPDERVRIAATMYEPLGHSCCHRCQRV